MAANSIANIKWNHFGVYRRFQLPVDVVGDLYLLLMVKINTVVPDFTDKLGWKGIYVGIFFACTLIVWKDINERKFWLEWFSIKFQVVY